MKIILAIIAITILETLALVKGVDGALLGLAMSSIVGVACFFTGRARR